MAPISLDMTSTNSVEGITGSFRRIFIPATILPRIEALLNEAARAHEEKCALLTGEPDKKGIIVREVVPVPNRARSNTAFSIAAEDFRQVDNGDYRVVAVFHTHRHTTRLSREDVRMITGSALVHLVGTPTGLGNQEKYAHVSARPLDLKAYANFEDNNIFSITVEVQR
jgi:proteasome lid subunit RPN8/RPN11